MSELTKEFVKNIYSFLKEDEYDAITIANYAYNFSIDYGIQISKEKGLNEVCYSFSLMDADPQMEMTKKEVLQELCDLIKIPIRDSTPDEMLNNVKKWLQ